MLEDTVAIMSHEEDEHILEMYTEEAIMKIMKLWGV